MNYNFKDITGQHFGTLTVLWRVGSKNHNTLWLCQCECGKFVEVQRNYLISGHTKSCGCYYRETRHTISRTHGMRGTKIYNVWRIMKQRCCDPNNNSYKYHGARGIRVCEKWQTFAGFYEDMGNGYASGLTIDRINNNGDYCKDNCKWSTVEEQNNNKRNNHYINFHGKTMTVAQAAKIYNIGYWVLYGRIRRGWRIEDALMTGS
jgi:hypothetical protein